MNSARAFVVGATGLVGLQLVRELLEDSRYSEVRTLSRSPLPIPPHPKLRAQIMDFEEILKIGEFFEAEHYFCCLGSTMKKAKSPEAFRRVDYDYPLRIARMATMKGLTSFHLVSARGANSHSPFIYFKTKGELEEEIRKLPIPRLLTYQPGLLLGERQEFRLGERIAEFALRWAPFKKWAGTPVSILTERMRNESFVEEFGKFTIPV